VSDTVTLPTFKIVDAPTPKTARKQPNPYDGLIHEMAGEAEASAKGCSRGRSADFRTPELAKLHENMIRRAARNHDPRVGISVIRTPVGEPNAKGEQKVNLVFAVIPKRVVNRQTGAVESPAEGVNGTEGDAAA